MKPIQFDKRVCACGGTRFHMMPKTFINGQTAVGLYCSEGTALSAVKSSG